MCLIKSKKRLPEKKHPEKAAKKGKHLKKYPDYLIEDPSIKHEAHSKWEADDIYDEDDFRD